jgi:uncharacterized protein YkwD
MINSHLFAGGWAEWSHSPESTEPLRRLGSIERKKESIKAPNPRIDAFLPPEPPTMKISVKLAFVLVLCLGSLLYLPETFGQIVMRRTPPGIQHLKEVEKWIYRYTNEARRKHGLLSLDRDEDLAALARAHSDDMLVRKFFGHENPDGLTIKERIPARNLSLGRIGENIWGGSGHDPSDARLLARMIVDGWVSSPGHRANILNPNYTHLGVGVSISGKDIRATQEFAQRAGLGR